MFLTEMVTETMRKTVPKNGKFTLFQSVNNVQIMLPELGFVNALRAYFEMHKIDYLVDERPNAEFMSPDGQLPLIRYGTRLVSGYHSIIEFINQEKDIQPKNGEQSATEKQICGMAFEKIVTEAERYYTWIDPDIYENYTKSNYSYGQAWPLCNILCWLKRREMESSIENIDNIERYNELEEVFRQISQIINDDEISKEMLCFIYGHLKAILQCEKPYEALANTVKKFPKLITFVKEFGKQG